MMTIKARSVKYTVFIAIMGALGNVLSGLSTLLVPLLPTVYLGSYGISVALDLSHLATFIVALYGGSVAGGLTGLVGGLVAANEFGFSKGNLVTGFALPVGKALTGVTAGFVMHTLDLQAKSHRKTLIAASTLVSYVPEAVFTVFLFLNIFPFVFGTPAQILYPVVITILAKASIEMIVEGLALAGLSSNQAFGGFLKSFFIGS